MPSSVNVGVAAEHGDEALVLVRRESVLGDERGRDQRIAGARFDASSSRVHHRCGDGFLRVSSTFERASGAAFAAAVLRFGGARSCCGELLVPRVRARRRAEHRVDDLAAVEHDEVVHAALLLAAVPVEQVREALDTLRARAARRAWRRPASRVMPGSIVVAALRAERRAASRRYREL